MSNWLYTYLRRALTFTVCGVLCFLCLNINPVYASLKDDRYDGNIFALYGGNGSLVPPRVTLEQSLNIGRPALIVFYVDDSSDCKMFTPMLNQAQAFYNNAISLIPIAVDSLNLDVKPKPTEEAYYYRGFVPQTVLIDGSGQVVFDREGRTDFAVVDAALRQVLGLTEADPRMQFRNPAKQINEINP